MPMRRTSLFSRPHRRLWMIPAVLDIYIHHSPRSVTSLLYQKSRLRSRVSSCDLDVRDCIELARAHARSQSRLLTQNLRCRAWRVKSADIKNGWGRRYSMKWSRMVTYGAQAPGGIIEQCEPRSRFDPMRRMSPSTRHRPHLLVPSIKTTKNGTKTLHLPRRVDYTLKVLCPNC